MEPVSGICGQGEGRRLLGRPPPPNPPPPHAGPRRAAGDPLASQETARGVDRRGIRGLAPRSRPHLELAVPVVELGKARTCHREEARQQPQRARPGPPRRLSHRRRTPRHAGTALPGLQCRRWAAPAPRGPQCLPSGKFPSLLGSACASSGASAVSWCAKRIKSRRSGHRDGACRPTTGWTCPATKRTFVDSRMGLRKDRSFPLRLRSETVGTGRGARADAAGPVTGAAGRACRGPTRDRRRRGACLWTGGRGCRPASGGRPARRTGGVAPPAGRRQDHSPPGAPPHRVAQTPARQHPLGPPAHASRQVFCAVELFSGPAPRREPASRARGRAGSTRGQTRGAPPGDGRKTVEGSRPTTRPSPG